MSNDKTMRSVRFGLVAMLVGSLYLIIPYSVGKKCLGMECLEYTISSIPVAFVGLPWSLLAFKVPATSDVKSKGIYRGSVLQRGYWLRISCFLAAYFLNIFLVFSLGHLAIKRFRGRKS